LKFKLRQTKVNITNPMNPKVDAFIARETKWQAEFDKLRKIILDFPLSEELKWGVPCYSSGKGNVVLIHGFKEYCAVLFFKGALLKDPTKILIQQTENVQAARHLRFKGLEDILKVESMLRDYIIEAIEIEKAGLKVNLKKTEEYNVPEEFKNKLDAMPALKTSFEALTPGRQRAYLFHFSQPKQSKTREDRIEKCIPKILSGKGLLD